MDLDAELRLAKLLRGLIAKGLLRTAHDLADGGLLISLAEACFGPRRLGARVEVPLVGADLFSETQARAIVACQPPFLDRVLRAAEEAGVPAREIGEVGGDELNLRSGGEILRAPVAGLHEAWSTGAAEGFGAVEENFTAVCFVSDDVGHRSEVRPGPFPLRPDKERRTGSSCAESSASTAVTTRPT